LLAFVFPAAALLALTGCLSVRAPEEIHIGSDRQAAHEERRAPRGRAHAGAQSRLDDANAEIHRLRDELRKCEKSNHKLTEQRDRYKAKYEDEKNHDDD